MSATFELQASPTFPEGTTVGAYPKWAFPGNPAAVDPGVVPAVTAVVGADGAATFSGLDFATSYFAGALVGAEWRFVGFRTVGEPSRSGPIALGVPAADGDSPVWDEGTGAWLPDGLRTDVEAETTRAGGVEAGLRTDVDAAVALVASTSASDKQVPRFNSSTNRFVWKDPDVADLRDWDHIRAWDSTLGAVLVSGQPRMTNTVTPFTSADVGKCVIVNQDSPATARFYAKIASVDGDGTAHLVSPADGTTPLNCPSSTTNQRVMWGWDEPISDALAELAVAGASTIRRAVLPGFHLTSQVIVPSGVEFMGTGWGTTYPYPMFPASSIQTAGTTIQQLPGVNSDLVRFAGLEPDDGGRRFVGPCRVSGLTLLAPPGDVSGLSYTAGSGLALKDAAGNDLYGRDGFFLDEIHAVGFFDHGFSFQRPLIPGSLRRLRGFYCGRYFINYDMLTLGDYNSQSVRFEDCSADGCGEGGIYISGLAHYSTVQVANFKSEANDLVALPRTASGQQENAVILNACDATPVEVSVTHLRGLGGSLPTKAPGAAIVIEDTTSSGLRPKVRYLVGERILGTQTTNLTNAVTLDDQVASVKIPQTVKAGEYPAPATFDVVPTTTSGASAVGVTRSGESYPRFYVGDDGSVYMSDGAGASDVKLYRSAANTLAVQSGKTLQVSLLAVLTSIGAGNCFIDASTGVITVTRSGAAVQGKISGDDATRITLGTDGLLSWGDGTNAKDTNLYRDSAGVLKTDNSLSVGGTLSAGKVSAPAYDRTAGQVGIYAPLPIAGFTQTVLATSNRAYYMRFVPSRDMAITKIAFVVVTQASSNDACDVGIFSSDLATKIVSAGATSGLLNSNGVKEVSVSCNLTAGTVYYAAFSVGSIGGTGANMLMTSYSSSLGAALMGSTAGKLEGGNIASAHPLAAGGTLLNGISGFPVLAIRES